MGPYEFDHTKVKSVILNLSLNEEVRPLSAVVFYGRDKKVDYVEVHTQTRWGLSAGKPLTEKKLRSVLRQLGERNKHNSFYSEGVLSKKIISFKPEELTWHVPSKQRTINVNGERITAYMPHTVFYYSNESLYVWAVKEKPRANTRLYSPPFWNCSSDGLVCMGNVRFPETREANKFAKQCTERFYQSVFTHGEDGLEELYRVHAQEQFPNHLLESMGGNTKLREVI